MDFYRIRTKETKDEVSVYPDFIVARSKDLMIRGGKFYAVWDEAQQMWSTDEYEVQRLVDEDLREYVKENNLDDPAIKFMNSFNTQSWSLFRKFIQQVSDSSHELDDNLTFANTEVKKSDYVSRRLPYSLGVGDFSAWDELVGTLYNVEERQKIEWAIGAVVAGDAKKIQKFLVLYGPAGTGKSTVLNIIQSLFAGYVTTFDAKALGSSGSAFSTEVFKNNPLVAIQHDGDLSKIDDNTKLNSIISHEDMAMNEKYKSGYTAKVNAFLFMGTNQPVKISDAKSGIIRRLIDVHPTGVKIPANHYHALMGQIDFQLGAIAQHCLDVYRALGKNHYNAYRPMEMMLQTDIFFNFIEANFDVFKTQDYTTLKQAFLLYKEYCADTGVERPLPQYKMREELRNYFEVFKDRGEVNGIVVRSYYQGFNANKFKAPAKEANTFSLVLDSSESLLDRLLSNFPAQGAKEDETPLKRWASVTTTLADINTAEVHFLKVPENHIVIDFDLKDSDGSKSAERNLEAASLWPPTYAEFSKSGAGIHLHYTYGGDLGNLARVFSEGIEIKVFTGDSSLRRKLSKCNEVPVAVITTGLPIREKKMLETTTIKSEKGLRDLILRNLRKEVHPGTKPSIDFIYKILEEAYSSGMAYDVTDMRARIVAFANNSSNQALTCLGVVQKMKFASEERAPEAQVATDDRMVIFDLEVYPNLFVLCWKYRGAPNDTIVRMINPTAAEVEPLLKYKLVGFNNRRYDNHIAYAAVMGYNNIELFNLSQKLVSNDRNAPFGEAYNISYADIWDVSSKKQSLKLFEVELGIHHMEMDLPWEEPVPEDKWQDVADYCANDVVATEAVLEDRWQDFVARQILADLSGLSVNQTTQNHTARIIFGTDKKASEEFVYTHLNEEFEGYVFDYGKSSYRGENPGEGGYVYAEPGMYENVAVLDIASMHPTTITQLNLFGKYTPRFTALKDARVAIKRGDLDSARSMLDGKLAPYLLEPESADKLAYALKIVINIVYGLTSAKFPNPFKDNRNIDNIVAKRGALFMIDLKHFVQEQGFTVAHIKTDSIKIPDATPEIIQDITNMGAKYGYEFEHEDTYERFCLVNDAVFVARSGGKWKAVGAQFQHPYVFKKLFTNEEIEFDDMCEIRSVMKGAMYLDLEYDRALALHSTEGMKFIGRTGRFVPVHDRVFGAGILYRVYDGKNYAVSGTKNHLWVEADVAKALGNDLAVDLGYFETLVDDARDKIDYLGSFANFIK